jgi:hypothetical protein
MFFLLPEQVGSTNPRLYYIENHGFLDESWAAAFRRRHLMDIVRKHLDKVEVLPMSPILLSKLLPKLADVDTNFDEVVEIITFDPALLETAADLQQRLFRPQIRSELSGRSHQAGRLSGGIFAGGHD